MSRKRKSIGRRIMEFLRVEISPLTREQEKERDLRRAKRFHIKLADHDFMHNRD